MKMCLFVMHLDDNNKLPLLFMLLTSLMIEMFHWNILLNW